MLGIPFSIAIFTMTLAAANTQEEARVEVVATGKAAAMHPKVAPTHLRNAWIREADLSTSTKGWDDVDLDVLVLRAGHLSEGELARRYSSFSPQSLRRLAKLVKSNGR